MPMSSPKSGHSWRRGRQPVSTPASTGNGDRRRSRFWLWQDRRAQSRASCASVALTALGTRCWWDVAQGDARMHHGPRRRRPPCREHRGGSSLPRHAGQRDLRVHDVRETVDALAVWSAIEPWAASGNSRTTINERYRRTTTPLLRTHSRRRRQHGNWHGREGGTRRLHDPRGKHRLHRQSQHVCQAAL